MLLENRLLGNVRVFLEIRFQHFWVGFVRRRVVSHHADPFDRDVSRLPSLAARSPSLLLQEGVGKLGRGFAHLVEFFFGLIFDLQKIID